MTDPLSIPIDLADPDSIRAKLPEVSRVVDAKRATLAAAQKDLERWRALESRLTEIAGLVGVEEPVSEPTAQSEPPKDRGGSVEVVTEVLEREGRPMRTAEIRALVSTAFKPDTVSWALWRASTDGRIQKLGRGHYAPLDHAAADHIFPADGGATPQGETRRVDNGRAEP